MSRIKKNNSDKNKKRNIKKKEPRKQISKDQIIKTSIFIILILIVILTTFFLGKRRNIEKYPYLTAIQTYNLRNKNSVSKKIEVDSDNNINTNNENKKENDYLDKEKLANIEKCYVFDGESDQNTIKINLSDGFNDKWVEKIKVRVSFKGEDANITPVGEIYKSNILTQNKNYIDFEFFKNTDNYIIKDKIDINNFDELFNYKNMNNEPFDLTFSLRSNDEEARILNIKILDVKDYNTDEIKEKYQKIESEMNSR